MMTKKELSQFLLQALNMGLGALMQGETSYTKALISKLKPTAFSSFPVYQQATSSMMNYIRKSF